MHADLYGNNETHQEFELFKQKNKVLDVASDILYFNLLQRQKKQASLDASPKNTVKSSLNHLVPSRSKKNANPVLLDGNTGEPIFETLSEEVENGKLKLVIQEVVPEDHLTDILDIVNAITRLESLRSKINPVDDNLVIEEYINQLTSSINVMTEEQVKNIKHADEQ